MDELISKEKEKSRLTEKRKKRIPITAPDPEPARAPVKSRLDTTAVRDREVVVNTPDSRRKIEEIRSKTRRDSRERRFSKTPDSGRNSRERLSRTPDSRDSKEFRKERRESDQGSRKRRASIPDSEREKAKLLNKVRQMRTSSKCEKKEAVNRSDEGEDNSVLNSLCSKNLYISRISQHSGGPGSPQPQGTKRRLAV